MFDGIRCNRFRSGFIDQCAANEFHFEYIDVGQVIVTFLLLNFIEILQFCCECPFLTQFCGQIDESRNN